MAAARVPFDGALTTVTGVGPSDPVSLATMSIVPGAPPARQIVSATATGAVAPRTLNSGSADGSSRVEAEYSQVPLHPMPLHVTRDSTRYSVAEPAGAEALATHAARAASSVHRPTKLRTVYASPFTTTGSV